MTLDNQRKSNHLHPHPHPHPSVASAWIWRWRRQKTDAIVTLNFVEIDDNLSDVVGVVVLDNRVIRIHLNLQQVFLGQIHTCAEISTNV